MSMETINFETETCCKCGIVFQVPEEFSENRHSDGATFYCPNGHGQHFTECDEDVIAKLQSENRDLQIEVRRLKCRLIGKPGFLDRIKVWWLGGLAK